MKNSEIVAKFKRVGLKGLTEFELRRVANIVWKKEMFTLNGLCKYARTTKDQFFLELLHRYGINQDVITVKWVLTHADPNKLVKKVKNENTDKYEPGTEKKLTFSLWFITDTAQRHNASIKALAQSNSVIIEKPKSLTEGEEELKKSEEEEAKSLAKKEANKRRREAAKAAKLAKEEEAKKSNIAA